MPAAVFDAARAARDQCPRFTGGNGGSPVDFTVSAAPDPPFGDRSWRVNYRMRVGEVTGSTTTVVIASGTSLVIVSMIAIVEPLDEAILDRALAAAVGELGKY